MEKLISKYKKILPDKNSIYYTAYITWLSISLLFGRSTLKTFLGISTSFWLKKVCYPICGVLILIVFSVSGFMEKPNKKQLKQYFFMGILVGVFGISWILSDSGTFFMQLMFIIAAKEINLQKLPRITIVCQMIIVPIIICLAMVGAIENISFMYERINLEPVYRQSLGFRHPNALGAQIVQFCICWLWIRWEKWKWYDYFLYVTAIWLVYTICNSITSIILILLTGAMNGIYRLLIKIKHTKLLDDMISICIWLIPAVCIIISYFYSETNPLITAADHIVSWRFKLANGFLRDNPATCIGTKLPPNIGSDCIYVDTITRYGWIILFFILLGMYRMLRYAIKNRMYPLIISIFIFGIYGITEHYPYLLMFNFTLIFLAYAIYGDTKRVT
jgi:hypothetical protein